jgi:hypothetical protein
MVMIRPKGKPEKIAAQVMKGKGVKLASSRPEKNDKKMLIPFLQH